MTGAREVVQARTTHMRANLIEYLLLGVAMAAIGFTMYETVRVGTQGDRTQDLTFAGTSAELGRTLAANGVARVGRLARATFVIGTDTVVADTIVITADSTREPAFAAGGFMRDQVKQYNDFAVRQALLSVKSNRPPRDESEAHTLLRTAWRDDGTRVLSDQPSPYGLIVRSPYAEDAWREVRTTDWHRSPALLGYDGDVSLPGGPVVGRFDARLNGRACTVSREAPEYYMYCQSALAASSSRFYDFDFQVIPTSNGGAFGKAGPYRQRSVWMNGRAVSLGHRPVHGGDVLELQALGPVELSAADWGTLAAEQWVNGRAAFANPNVGTLGFFAAAGRTMAPASAAADPLVLSFDAALTRDLDAEARRFLSEHERLLTRLAVVILDVRTGEVRAIAEPARRSDDEPLLSFEPILVGSVVKPIMASAILSRRPELGNLEISYAGDTVAEVAGVPLSKPFANEANGCSGQIAFDDYIRCSSNEYAAELMIRSLEADGWHSHKPGAVVPRAVLERSAIAAGLADVFDVDAYANRTPGRLALYWSADSASSPGASAATTDRRLYPYESRPWILFPDSAGTRVDWLARYAFGGWENRWTLLGLSQAYARIATGRDVQATFLHRDRSAADSFALSSRGARAAFERVRAALRQVPVNGTAAGLAERLRASVRDSVVVLAKTGTLNEQTAGGRIKSLVMAIGRADGASRGAALRCGLVAVTYFEFADDPRARAERTALPRIHRDFAEGPLSAVLSRQWGRVSGCPARVVMTDRPQPRQASK
jgi:hypothetical protein